MPKNEQTLYRHVLADAWKLAWRRRGLWPFAFFASLAATGGIVDVVLRSGDDIFQAEVARLAGTPAASVAQMLRLVGPTVLSAPPGWLVLSAVLGMLVVAALVWVALVCQGALIAGITADELKSDPRKALGRGIAAFWPLFGINVAYRVLIAATVFATAVPFAAALERSAPGTMLLYLLTYVAFVLVGTVLAIVAVFTAIDVTASGSSLWHAAKNAARTFGRHWVVSLEAALVVFGIDVLAGVALLIGATLLSVPLVLFLLVMRAIGTAAGMWVFLTVFLALLAGWIILLASFATTLRYAVWTLLYERLQSRSVTAKIVRVLRALPAALREGGARR